MVNRNFPQGHQTVFGIGSIPNEVKERDYSTPNPRDPSVCNPKADDVFQESLVDNW